MRKIKFRAWNKKGVYANTMVSQDGPDLDGVIYYTATVEGQDIYYNFEDIMDKREFIIMQYTGLKDKNGKEIYEGDVLTHESLPVTEIVKWKEQIWTEEGFMTGFGEWWGTADQYEIIGNIHENPELVKEVE